MMAQTKQKREVGRQKMLIRTSSNACFLSLQQQSGENSRELLTAYIFPNKILIEVSSCSVLLEISMEQVM
jgi:hypothetical protein